MLRIIEIYNSVPSTFPVHKNAEFQPGFIGQLYVEGDETVIGVSDGSAPFGILDDIKTSAFTSAVWDETVIARCPAYTNTNGKVVSQFDTIKELNNPNIIASSFVSIPMSCTLIAKNGMVVFPAGTELNYKSGGAEVLANDSGNNSIKTTVRYTYQQPNIIGDDTTKHSGRATIWATRGIYSTDIFETTARYPVNAMLFVSPNGKLTTERALSFHPSVGMVVQAPSAKDNSLRFMWA